MCNVFCLFRGFGVVFVSFLGFRWVVCFVCLLLLLFWCCVLLLCFCVFVLFVVVVIVVLLLIYVAVCPSQ